MINCSHCGTQNRDGSKFCSDCGARLTPVSGLICPMCGAANKVESVFCLNCGARLVPLTAASAPEKPQPVAPPIKGLSLPARESPGELPAELQKLEAELAEPEEKETSPGRDDLRATPAAEEGTPPAEAEEVPDWLSSAKTVTPSQPAEAKTETEIELAAAVPSWLQKLRPIAAPEKSEETPDVSVEQVPDWLKVTESTQPKPESKEPPPAEPSAETTETPAEQAPDWLTTAASTTQEPASKELEPEGAKTATPPIKESPAPTSEEPAPTPVTEGEIPPWLLELRPKAAESPTTAAGETEKPTEPLLESLESQIPSDLTAGQIPFPAPLPSFSTSSDDDIPDWLRTVPSAPAVNVEPIPVSAETETPPTIQPALPEEVPDWLASLKPAEQPVAEETIESSGPLAGLRGVLPLALAMAEPHPPQKPATPEIKGDGGKLLESILATPQFETTHPAATTQRRVLTMRPLIYLLVALAVLIPFFIPSDWASSAVDISNPLVTSFYDTLQALPANSTVLMSFDYDPSQSGEMDLQATAIVQHLIKKRVKIIAMSTLATGAPMAQRILDEAARGATNYAYGTNYLNLGYWAGYEAGLSNLATGGFRSDAQDFSQHQDLSTFAAFANVKTLRDMAVVIELAGSEDPLKMWMEQVQPSGTVKIIAGVSASVEPKARAYYDTPNKQLAAVVSGLVGAAQYEVLANQPGLALTSLNAQNVAQLVLVLIILLGNIVFWTRRNV